MPSLLCARETGLRALVDDGEVALNAARADHVRMRLAGLAPLERRKLGFRSVEDGVVRDEHVGARFRGDFLEPARRPAVGLAPETRGAIRGAVCGLMSQPVERPAAPRP